MQTEAAQAAWEKRLNFLRQAAHDYYSNCTATIEDYDGDKERYATEMIDEFLAGYLLGEAEEGFVTALFGEMVGIEERNDE